jgi:hypothetical protein
VMRVPGGRAQDLPDCLRFNEDPASSRPCLAPPPNLQRPQGPAKTTFDLTNSCTIEQLCHRPAVPSASCAIDQLWLANSASNVEAALSQTLVDLISSKIHAPSYTWLKQKFLSPNGVQT